MQGAVSRLLAGAAAMMMPSILTETRQSMAVKAAQDAADALGVRINAAQSIMLSFDVIPFSQPGGQRAGSYTKRGPGRKAHKSKKAN